MGCGVIAQKVDFDAVDFVMGGSVSALCRVCIDFVSFLPNNICANLSVGDFCLVAVNVFLAVTDLRRSFDADSSL